MNKFMNELLQKIVAKRNVVHAYVVKHEPKNKLLVNVAIICGIAGTALAGIPAVGGSAAIDGIKAVTQPQLPIWQILCIGAALSTMAATIATSLRSNHDTSNKLAKAQVCEAKLEILELLLTNNQIEIKEAIERYGDYTSEVAFIK
ncbi:hypothetical protein [Chryseolinea sp. H1M3-3]|uniref:hypothetical protein n=1 Tax=Chryseolinea sp. H1M3-3 TaxID=3034144 RepID=UPI0023EC1D38|nr:hypothetical protein [Chryseolinea sp. H1M3-3]